MALLHQKARRRGADSAGRCKEIPPSLQTFHGTDRTLPARSLSGTQPLASPRAPRTDHSAPALGGHARAKAVAALAHQLARLVSPLHGPSSSDSKCRQIKVPPDQSAARSKCRSSAKPRVKAQPPRRPVHRPCKSKLRRLIRSRPCAVNAIAKEVRRSRRAHRVASKCSKEPVPTDVNWGRSGRRNAHDVRLGV